MKRMLSLIILVIIAAVIYISYDNNGIIEFKQLQHIEDEKPSWREIKIAFKGNIDSTSFGILDSVYVENYSLVQPNSYSLTKPLLGETP